MRLILQEIHCQAHKRASECSRLAQIWIQYSDAEVKNASNLESKVSCELPRGLYFQVKFKKWL